MNAKDEADTKAELELRGPFTLRHAPGIRDRLLAALKQHNHLILALTDDDEVDISFVQILLAARLSARIAGGYLRLKSPPGQALSRVIAQAGFTNMESLWPSEATG